MTDHGPNTPAALASDPAPAAPPEGSARATRSGQRWTPDKMAAFLRALAGTHSVRSQD